MIIKKNPNINELQIKDIIVLDNDVYEVRKDNKLYDLMNGVISLLSVTEINKEIVYLFRYR